MEIIFKWALARCRQYNLKSVLVAAVDSTKEHPFKIRGHRIGPLVMISFACQEGK